ncbi:lysophospholipid acyltransferase family protein [Actinokineospora bangkokensis]|uniref:1-acyl-sn-glycerol-3-phosphate acyltransferase n=1 Tax=Actinokineospora bangkokensis TaxID=1193682 RepID=A0A1Q9LHY5_9PSEU|nr:1-acyl-sn-glycerol-3-phosphate acyltransferase [Actinokineospora bangkokensis]OLR91638.1 1-acyl-sn-glycerol-3-phosphate acyltransferase [Actinokineospora bangkokensis]
MSHAWMPTSPCGPACLTGDEPAVGALRAGLRVAGAVAVLLLCVLAVPVLPLVGSDRFARFVFRSLLRAFGVRLEVTGAAALRAARGRGALVATNHISWLDIAAVNAVRPMKALAKLDIKAWPVLGRVVAAAGTVFLDRESLRALPATMARLSDVLRSGAHVYACPEGTTWCGQGGGRFRHAVFQAAIDGGVPVRPIALRFRMADGRETTAPAFIGDETIVDSVRRVARLRGLVLEVHVLDELAPGRAGTRRELAALTEAAINSALGRATTPVRKRIPAQQRRTTTRRPSLPQLRQGA